MAPEDLHASLSDRVVEAEHTKGILPTEPDTIPEHRSLQLQPNLASKSPGQPKHAKDYTAAENSGQQQNLT
ncbi:hypothetical protein RHGRI_016446 [Rhododendron griersonianum]|uniref:Uncharacterized protein n=1 Tax=Rhododendron griersonianum TaxID=479676 RepID=A0AAV6JU59_9ERIC|nr:hypothetical protein RHGRI_016446 [Rhododendron griersonianum]